MFFFKKIRLSYFFNLMSSLKSSYDYVIIGGGVSGVICAQTLSSHAPESSIAIFSVSPVLKSVFLVEII